MSKWVVLMGKVRKGPQHKWHLSGGGGCMVRVHLIKKKKSEAVSLMPASTHNPGADLEVLANI